jgi:hypothetical protein
MQCRLRPCLRCKCVLHPFTIYVAAHLGTEHCDQTAQASHMQPTAKAKAEPKRRPRSPSVHAMPDHLRLQSWRALKKLRLELKVAMRFWVEQDDRVQADALFLQIQGIESAQYKLRRAIRTKKVNRAIMRISRSKICI